MEDARADTRATKIVLMYYKDGADLRSPTSKKSTRIVITAEDNDVIRLKRRTM